MSKKKVAIIFGIILLVTCLILLGYGRRHRADIAKRADDIAKTCPRYEIDVAFDPEEKKVVALQKVTIFNDKTEGFEQLYFNLYPNAFKTFDKAPFPRVEMERAYPEGFAPGYINIKNIMVGSSEVNYEIEDTLLKVILKETFQPKNKLVLTVEFEAIIPPSYGRFGYGQNTFNIANWYPILAVCDDEGWHNDPYYNIGDPFYSEVALYQVRIKAPKDYIVAASGSLQEKRNEGDHVIWSFDTGLVRDFAWIAGTNFNIKDINVGNTRITSYYLEDDEIYGTKALEYAQKAIVFFNEYFGVYPYDDYSVVAADFYIGGMEYPNLVMIGSEFYSDGGLLEYVVVHETAHQWWYGLIGNNQIEESWLDEALAEYSTVLYYEHIYGKRAGRRIYEQAILNPYKHYEAVNTPGPILRHLCDFIDWREYSATVYYRGAIMLKDLESRIGKGKLREALRYYFEQNLYKNATTTDLIEALNRACGVDWTEYIYNWLQSTEPLDKAA
ncbi:MAG: M1 family metallopeptidase [Tepidanaerobacteraceae bacterium]|nr:M1 family metallopeptidase [Tepidanaerobacteraceae bacterium]